MNRVGLYGGLLGGLAIAASALLASRIGQPGATGGDEAGRRPGSNAKAPAAAREKGDGDAALERRLQRLTATLAAEANERQRLEERLEVLAAELAALRAGEASGNASAAAEPAPTAASGGGTTEAPRPVADDDTATAIERALIAAGVDAATAADIKRRRDELTLSELYLRDEAEREQWLNTPHFRDEMAEIERQRTSIRDEIGDDAYDRYLAAAGQPNRVSVDEVLSDSAAAQAGLLSGDVVLRYGDLRIFAPGELVAETRVGRAGENVRVEVLRNGERVEILVPRGPLGLRIASSHGTPDGS